MENSIKMDLKRHGIRRYGLIWLRIGTSIGNEPSDSVKYWENFEQVRKWRLLKKGSLELLMFPRVIAVA
jgi:hypothetical protein